MAPPKRIEPDALITVVTGDVELMRWFGERVARPNIIFSLNGRSFGIASLDLKNDNLEIGLSKIVPDG